MVRFAQFWSEGLAEPYTACTFHEVIVQQARLLHVFFDRVLP
jgi:hypothetical protein